jgi:hypothetical protein
MHEQELQGIVDALRDLTQRFGRSTSGAGSELSSEDRAAFKRLILEAKSILGEALGQLNEFNLPLVRLTALPGFGMFNPPSLEDAQEAVALVEGGINSVRRKANRPASLPGSPPKPPYVATSRIAEFQGLKDPRFDPRRLVRMLQELNLAHANDMDMATAMLVRAVTDHVPPIFGKATFPEVAAQYPGGRSFKGSMSHLSDSMKHIADGLLHVHIRPIETLPNSTQVDFRQSLDVLLGELVRLLRAS